MSKERNFFQKAYSMLNDANPLVLKPDINQVKEHSKYLSKMVSKEYDLDIVIGIARGGLFPAYEVSRNLGVELDNIHVSRYSKIKFTKYVPGLVGILRSMKYSISKEPLLKPTLVKNMQADVKGKNVLIVDDEVGKGRTMEFSKEIINRNKPSEIKTAALFSTQKSYEPDFFVFKLFNRGLALPWSIASPHYEEFCDEFKNKNSENQPFNSLDF